jgi:hypothetical protein
MKTTLTIRWDGSTPGLSEHALSLGAWLNALRLLNQAVRRTASGIATTAVGRSEYGAQGGRLHKTAREIDLRLTGLSEGCANIHLDCVTGPSDGQQDVFSQTLPARALTAVLEAIEAEARGELTNAPVRRFLRALPPGVEVQQYRLDAGDASREVNITVPNLPVIEATGPLLSTLTGQVVGVTFEPAKWQVTIKTAEGSVTLSATEAQVDAAVALRGVEVRAVALLGEAKRLVGIRAADHAGRLRSPREREVSFTTKWARTLEILGQ